MADPLQQACHYQDLEAMKQAILADPPSINSWKKPLLGSLTCPLFICINNKFIDGIKLLMAHNVYINETAFNMVLTTNNLPVLKLFLVILPKELLLNKTNIIYCDDIECLKLLVDYGFDINWQNELGYTLLHKATMVNSYKRINWLLEKGADPEIRDSFNNSPKDYSKDDRTINLFISYELPIIKEPED